jgi:hypothetical protein
MASTDSHQGGDLFDMAAKGTSIPGDAGVMNIIPSKPRPGEGQPTNAAESTLAAAAENPRDIPRSVQDIGATGEVETGTGYVLVLFLVSRRSPTAKAITSLPFLRLTIAYR